MTCPMSLAGKHILITGASSGIGRQCAIQASRLGARVSLAARDRQRLEETRAAMEDPGAHRCFPFDLERTGEIGGLVEAAVEEGGPLDGLCHGVGMAAGRPLRDCRPEFVQRVFRVHAFAFLELVRCLSLGGRLRDGASLVGVSSVAAQRGGVSQAAYAAAKAAVNGLVAPAALELAPRRIRVNAVAYAMVDTPMFREFMEASGDPRLLERQALGVIDAASAANAVMFLLGDACPFITGAVLPVYAGY